MKTPDYLIIVNTQTCANQPYTKDDLIAKSLASKSTGGLGLVRPRVDDMIDLEGQLQNIIPINNISDVDLWGISEGEKGLTGLPKYVAYVGGLTKDGSKEWDTRTQAQKASLETYVKYQILLHPTIQVLGLNQVPALDGTEEPAFNVEKWLVKIGVNEANIFQ